MRSAKEFINIMKEQFEEQYNYLKDKANEINEQGEHKYFLGLRKDRVCLYYKGMRMAEISLVDGNKIVYEMDKYYNPKEDKKPLTFVEFSQKDNFEYIKKKIDMHVTGLHDNKRKKEKVCQQWIINKNNESRFKPLYASIPTLSSTNATSCFPCSLTLRFIAIISGLPYGHVSKTYSISIKYQSDSDSLFLFMIHC